MNIKSTQVNQVIEVKKQSNQEKRIIKIFGDFKEISGRNVNGISEGRYLYIETIPNGQETYIPFQKFQELVSEAKTLSSTKVFTEESQVKSSVDVLKQETIRSPDFKELLNYLVTKINLSLKNGEDEIVVTSEEAIFLELPWEDIVEEKISVIREVIPQANNDFEERENNLLLLVSHAEELNGNNLTSLREKLDDEISDIYSLVGSIKKNEIPKSYKLQTILLSIHTTKELLKSLQWEKYNYVHLIMHGINTGELCFETVQNHKVVDSMTIEELLGTLKSYHFQLLFFSFCFSGGGVNSSESLAFQIVRRGISKYVVGYSSPVGENSASLFAKYFYDILLNGTTNERGGFQLEAVYKEALKKYYSEKSNTKYVPYLYVNK
ncbi:MAG: CHAT domain-containing protein [Terrimicrobiaceae bacterium]|nr:CHAT domain-containing protein [Terrimicrobiaceae bacterium]